MATGVPARAARRAIRGADAAPAARHHERSSVHAQISFNHAKPSRVCASGFSATALPYEQGRSNEPQGDSQDGIFSDRIQSASVALTEAGMSFIAAIGPA